MRLPLDLPTDRDAALDATPWVDEDDPMPAAHPPQVVGFCQQMPPDTPSML